MLSELAEVDPFSHKFAYVQVADILTAGIHAGQLAGWLPAEPELARALRTSHATVRRGIVLLRERGFVTTVHGRGNFAARPAPASATQLALPPAPPDRPDRQLATSETRPSMTPGTPAPPPGPSRPPGQLPGPDIDASLSLLQALNDAITCRQGRLSKPCPACRAGSRCPVHDNDEYLITRFTDRTSECPCRSPGPGCWAS